MKKFKLDQTGNITLAINTLSLERYIDGYDIRKDFAQVNFDCFHIRITCPIDAALNFTLFDLADNIICSVTTDAVIDALPIRRLILSMFGIVMMQSFKTEWDGYTLEEFSNDN